MGGSHSEGLDSKVAKVLKPETQASKRRKVVQKTVVRVKIEANERKQRSEGPPSDSWSWRKYGQKPIKGSPYPRGYYRCSTSKGCSAKKQVERCRTDASMLIITYTSSHNHPGPNNLLLTNHTQQSKEPETQITAEDPPTTPHKEEKEEGEDDEEEEEEEEEKTEEKQPIVNSQELDANQDHFHYSQSPFNTSFIINQQENPFGENLESTTYESPSVLFDKESLSYPPIMTFSTIKSEENDFYDELEELPSSSSFTSFLRSSFFDERILVHPS